MGAGGVLICLKGPPRPLGPWYHFRIAVTLLHGAVIANSEINFRINSFVQNGVDFIQS